MTSEVEAVVDAIIADWRTRLPSLAEIAKSEDIEVVDDFAVAAIHLSLVLSRYDLMKLRYERNAMIFGSEIARLSPPSESARTYAIRSFATSVVDSILCATGTVTRDRLIESVIARAQLLPLAPVEREPNQ